MIRSAVLHPRAFICLIEDINLFDFEDRKQIQKIVTELISSQNGLNELVMVVKEHGMNILE